MYHYKFEVLYVGVARGSRVHLRIHYVCHEYEKSENLHRAQRRSVATNCFLENLSFSLARCNARAFLLVVS
jgi:hypothetical protein